MSLYDTLRETLHREDIEDLISAGAPDNEYDEEASMIAEALQSARSKQDAPLSNEQIRGFIITVWKHMFEIDDDQAKMRMSGFNAIAERIRAAIED